MSQAFNLQKLELPNSHFHNYQLKEVLQTSHLTRLRSLSLRGADLSLINFDELCARFSNLESLDVTAVTYLPDHHLIHLTRIQPLRALLLGDETQSLRPIQDLTQLTALKLEISNKFLWEPQLWARFANLEVLDLHLKSRNAFDIPSGTLTRVTRLTLNNSVLDGSLLLRLTALPNLERLSLDNSRFHTYTTDEFMARCTALTHLSAKSFLGYLNGLAKLTQLRELHAIGASIYSDHLKAALLSITSLVSLSFSVRWPFTQEQAVPLLTKLRKLRALELGGMSDVDQVLTVLGEHLTNLRSLDFSTSVSRRIAEMTYSLIRFPHLTRVILPPYLFKGDWF